MRKTPLVTDSYYHVYNRGVDKRKIFLDDTYYYRFIHGLFRFNRDDRGSTSERSVDIICFCLMPNHFHLILKQIRENGITKFMQKIGTGYTMYFNQRCQRTGSLFEGRFKTILIEEDEYLIHLSRYIHLNPIDLVEPDWKEEGIKDRRKADKFLEQYKWSSYLDYTGKRNFPSIINKKFLLNYFKSDDYLKFMRLNLERFNLERMEKDLTRQYLL